MKKIIVLILLCFVSLFAEENEQRSYELGEGIQVASLPLYVGGYFSTDYTHSDTSDIYRIDDLAVLGYGNYDKFSYMAEFEFKSFYVQTESNSQTTITQDKKIHTERLYLDYNHDENYMFRVGKYNSPIGYWNLLPVNVLRDTSSNPVSTSIIFPKYTTGVSGTYTSFNEGDLAVDVMLQHNDDLDTDYNNYHIDEHYALGLTYTKDNLSVKLNTGIFDDLRTNGTTEILYYGLVSLQYDTNDFKIMSEIGSQRSKNDITTNYAGYVQGLYRFTEKHIGIVRAESYDDKFNNVNENIGIIGYTYRPLFPVAFKTEYQFHSISRNDNFIVSFSVMF